MGNFNRDRGDRGRSFGNNRGRFHRGGDRPRPTLHKTTCANCGKECEVPFKPTGEKPVYCRDCFRQMGGGENRQERRPEERNFSRPQENSQYQKDFAVLNDKLDKILAILNAAVAAEERIEEKIVEEVAPEKKKRSPKKSATE